MLKMRERLTIDRLGQRGEGVSQTAAGLVFTPYALAGETIIAEVDGDRGALVEIVARSPDRTPPFCDYYGACGGCAIQTLAGPAYAVWKRALLADALAHAGLKTDVSPLIDAHGEGRRRATFHARYERHPLGAVRIDVGFMRARSHAIVDIEACPVLAPQMREALAAAHAVAASLASLAKPLDMLVTATLEGLDLDIRGAGPLAPDVSRALTRTAERLDLARVSNHGVTIVERRAPLLAMGRAHVAPPPGAFLQATAAGEEALAGLVDAALGKAKRVADLFAGVGTFALRLGARAEIHAVEADEAALAALARAAHNTPGLRHVTTERRDLLRRPLAGADLARYDAVVFDPPRAGAQAQAEALAASAVPVVVAVSCNAQTFARDANILVGGGYSFERATPVDQFRFSPHIEIVGVFRRASPKPRRRGRLLG